MLPLEPWRPAPKALALEQGWVHVWRASLRAPVDPVLSPDEREKASQFHFEKDRRRYVAARTILRRLISRYENTPAGQIEFIYNSYGKPAIKNGALRFNASHSADLALFALTRGNDIGVDLEQIRPDFAARQIASQFFAPDEIAALRATPKEAQTAAFFRCWTRKEAFIKAHGSGLSLPLHQFVVSLDNPALLIRTDFDPAAAEKWTLHDLAVAEDYTAALAVEDKPQRIECWQWT